MTYEELVNNIAKSNSRSSNYLRMVGQRSYQECIAFNEFVKELQEEKRRYKEQGIITQYKPYKGKMYTVYTKIPKFRTYKQQFAITVKTLEKELYYAMVVDTAKRLIMHAKAHAYEETILYVEGLTGDAIFDPAESEAQDLVFQEAYNTKLTELGNKYHLDVTPYLKKEV